MYKISTIQIPEYVELISSWHYYTNKKQYDCENQIETLSKRPNSETLIEGFKNRNGCDGRRTEKPRQVHNDLAFHDCYCNHLDYGFSHWLQMYEQYQNGFLPYKGSAQEQPNKCMELLSIISQLKQELENKQQQDANKNKRK